MTKLHQMKSTIYYTCSAQQLVL